MYHLGSERIGYITKQKAIGLASKNIATAFLDSHRCNLYWLI